MKRIIFTLYILLLTSISHSQSFTMQVEDSFSYYHHGNEVFITKCCFKNMTLDTLVMWISDSVCHEYDDNKNINEYTECDTPNCNKNAFYYCQQCKKNG